MATHYTELVKYALRELALTQHEIQQIRLAILRIKETQ